MSDADWNNAIRLYPTDRIFAAVFEPLIPKRVRPNHLTVLRLLMIPPTLLLLAEGRYVAGFWMFLIASVTDWFDGSLARTRKQITEWGIRYDPFVDKLLIGSVLFFVVMEHVNLMLGFALLAVEALMIVVGWRQSVRGSAVPANFWGKAKMVTEVVGISMLLVALMLDVNLLVSLSTGTLALALVFALVSIFYRIR